MAGMEKLISSKGKLQSVPECYVLPQERRPGNSVVPLCTSIPVIDLQGDLTHDRGELVKKIIKASQEFGFFQVINHGVSKELMIDVMGVAKEFFALPAEDKASYYSEDPNTKCRLYTSIDYLNEKVHFWRDNLRHSCHPLDDHINDWPINPPTYRSLVGKYSVDVRKLSLVLLGLIWEGLGIDPATLDDGLWGVLLMSVNHYPPCPDPSLTLGLPKHGDVNLITILDHGDVLGLQVLKDDQWIAIEPLPGAFVVNISHTLKVISNGRLKSAEHRVVTNKDVGRTAIASFIHPCGDSLIKPAESLVNESSTALYRPFVYKDFVSSYITDTHEGRSPFARYEYHIS